MTKDIKSFINDLPIKQSLSFQPKPSDSNIIMIEMENDIVNCPICEVECKYHGRANCCHFVSATKSVNSFEWSFFFDKNRTEVDVVKPKLLVNGKENV